MAKAAGRMGPIVCTGACLERDETELEIAEEVQHLRSAQVLPKNDAAILPDAAGPQDRLGQIRTSGESFSVKKRRRS